MTSSPPSLPPYSRTLLILRHAKSDWGVVALGDRNRPLAPRGRRAIKKVAAYMAAHGYRPDAVFCSSARRTAETWQGLKAAWGETADGLEAVMMNSLYLASASSALALIHHGDDRHRVLLVIGHNPGWGELASRLSGDGPAQDMTAMRTKFPTAALAVIGFEAASWRDVAWGRGRLLDYCVPRRLPAA